MFSDSNTLWKRLKSWLATASDLLTLSTALVSGVAALISYQLDARRLTLWLLIIAASGLLAWVLLFVVRWTRYKFFTTTTVELHGGNSLTLVIQNKGLPVKVRARAEFREFGDDMESHPAPFDLRLFTEPYGGQFELIDLNDSVDMAKSILGQLQKLADDAAQFSIDRPGLSSFMAVAHDRASVLAYLNITVRVITPVGKNDIAKSYRLHVSHEAIRVVDDTESPDAKKVANRSKNKKSDG